MIDTQNKEHPMENGEGGGMMPDSAEQAVQPKTNWSLTDALTLANTLANHGWTRDANADAASSCIYALCRLLKDGNNTAGEHASNTVARKALHRVDMLLVSLNCDSAQKRVVDTCRMIVKQLSSVAFATHATAENSSAVGNEAKLREALEKCANMAEQIDCQLGSSDETVYAFRYERSLAHDISECAHAALAAPPRNCEKYATVDEAMEDFADEALIEEWNALKAGKDRDMLAEELFAFTKWLFALATETKGGNDGN